ncbi:trypsin-like serine protease [Vibrio chagasii]|nr:trypsin-like serine protease [Vibrio chagasii]
MAIHGRTCFQKTRTPTKRSSSAGASFIGERYVLTAAHCIRSKQ